MQKRALILFLLLINISLHLSAQEQGEDFVRVSLIVADPGDEIYSCLGHTSFRLQCPSEKLDFCFSYEGDQGDKVRKFLSGKMRMGMLAIPTPTFLDYYRQNNRGVQEYNLNLPLEVKKQLWKTLDEIAAQGLNRPYDFLNYGCAQACYRILNSVLKEIDVQFAPWAEKYSRTQKEVVYDATYDYPWYQLYWMTLVGSEGDRDKNPSEKLILPNDLVEVWRGARIDGTPLITDAPHQLLPAHPRNPGKPFYVYALVIGWFLACVLCATKKRRCVGLGITLVTIQSLIGCFIFYLTFISDLVVAQQWNYLIIPFNPLPILFWRWRKQWAHYYAFIMLLWLIVMIAWTHRIVHPFWCIAVLAYIILYLRTNNKLNKFIHKKVKRL